MKQSFPNRFPPCNIKQPEARYHVRIYRNDRGQQINRPREDEIKHRLLQSLLKELEPFLEYVHIVRDEITGKEYGGFYDYEPAGTPIAEDIYIGRISLFQEMDEKFKVLDSENLRLKAELAQMKSERDKYARALKERLSK